MTNTGLRHCSNSAGYLQVICTIRNDNAQRNHDSTDVTTVPLLPLNTNSITAGSEERINIISAREKKCQSSITVLIERVIDDGDVHEIYKTGSQHGIQNESASVLPPEGLEITRRSKPLTFEDRNQVFETKRVEKHTNSRRLG
jgi:hypothetical protein